MKKTRKCIKNINNLLLHHDKRTTTPTMMKIKKKMKKKFNQDPSKSFHELEKELLRIILSRKSTMISKQGESLRLKLV